MKKSVMSVVTCLLFCVAGNPGFAADKASADEAYKGKITISGAWALYPMVVKWGTDYQKLHPDVKIDVSAGGAGKGMADALSGAVDLGMVSRSVNKAEIDKGAWWVSVVKDAVVPTINTANPAKDAILKKGLKKEEFADIWITAKATNWNALAGIPGNSPIHCYTRSDSCGAAETWAKYLGKNQEDLKGVGVYGDPGLAEAVRKDITGVGYNNINFLFDSKTKKPVDGICALPIDINGNGKIDSDEAVYATLGDIVKAIADGKYPSPPARDLHLVSNGLPKRKVVVEFLRWVLTEGQGSVGESGYINLPAAKLTQELAKLGSEKKDAAK
jgi:phosphate transport system substrate-binding protein